MDKDTKDEEVIDDLELPSDLFEMISKKMALMKACKLIGSTDIEMPMEEQQQYARDFQRRIARTAGRS